MFNPRSTKGGGYHPLTPPPWRFVSGRTKTQKESDPGHLGHLFYILWMKKKRGTP